MDVSDDINEVEWLEALEATDPVKAHQEYLAFRELRGWWRGCSVQHVLIRSCFTVAKNLQSTSENALKDNEAVITRFGKFLAKRKDAEGAQPKRPSVLTLSQAYQSSSMISDPS